MKYSISEGVERGIAEKAGLYPVGGGGTKKKKGYTPRKCNYKVSHTIIKRFSKGAWKLDENGRALDREAVLHFNAVSKLAKYSFLDLIISDFTEVRRPFFSCCLIHTFMTFSDEFDPWEEGTRLDTGLTVLENHLQ